MLLAVVMLESAFWSICTCPWRWNRCESDLW